MFQEKIITIVSQYVIRFRYRRRMYRYRIVSSVQKLSCCSDT